MNKLNIEKEELHKKKINSYNLDWINKFKETGLLDKIDRNIVDSYIENIFVDDNKNVDLRLRYIDQYEEALKYLKKQNNMI